MKKKFNWRAFISFALTYSFIVIFISGVVLYISPAGRYAHWVTWKIAGFTKEEWQAFHTIFSFSFVVLSIFHLFTINWKAFLSYLKSKTQKGLNKKREFFISTTLFIVFIAGIISGVPPFQSVMNLGEHFTESWEKAEEEPPVPHAELLTLAELAHQLNYESVEQITEKLQRHGFKYENTNMQTLREIAEANKTTPITIYEKITQKTVRQGQGIGRKSLEEFATEMGKDVNEVLTILKENNIKAQKYQTLKDIGEQNDIPPRDIVKLIDPQSNFQFQNNKK